MEIRFRTRELQRCFEQDGRAQRRWGSTVGAQYRQRVALVQLAATWQDVYELRTLGLHPLHGDRAGQLAIRLTGAMRLIVERGRTATEVIVINVEDYHG